MAQPGIQLVDVSKYYRLYRHDFDRVREMLTGRARHEAHYALRKVSLAIRQGEVVGVVGKNGAGKSTLLKLLAGTLQPSAGTISIAGRVAALLELGASFHPEMSGHDNIYLNAAILGLSKRETDAIHADIVEFSGIGAAINRPVKTYSSGMFVRLAFAVATHIDPDILIIDEALSVGDGVFARKSFDRVMDFKRAGKTILFCSHSLYQVEALCDRVLWLEQGEVRADGAPAEVITAYDEFLRMQAARDEAPGLPETAASRAELEQRYGELPRIMGVEVRVDGKLARAHKVQSGHSTVEVQVAFYAPRGLPLPSVGLTFTGGDGRIVASVGSVNDRITLTQDEAGLGRATVVFPQFPLLKGSYHLDAYLMCEQGLHIYEAVVQATELHVEQQGLALGIVELPHRWN